MRNIKAWLRELIRQNKTCVILAYKLEENSAMNILEFDSLSNDEFISHVADIAYAPYLGEAYLDWFSRSTAHVNELGYITEISKSKEIKTGVLYWVKCKRKKIDNFKLLFEHRAIEYFNCPNSH